MEFALEMAASHCPLLERLIYFSVPSSVYVQNIAGTIFAEIVQKLCKGRVSQTLWRDAVGLDIAQHARGM